MCFDRVVMANLHDVAFKRIDGFKRSEVLTAVKADITLCYKAFLKQRLKTDDNSVLDYPITEMGCKDFA